MDSMNEILSQPGSREPGSRSTAGSGPTSGAGSDKATAKGGDIGSLKPLPASEFGYAQARHLLWRAGFGGTPMQIQTLVNWGSEKSVDYLLDAEKVTYDDASSKLFDKDIMRPPSEEERLAYQKARKSQNEDEVAKFRLERQRRERDDRAQIQEMQKWWLKRMIETPKPLEEKMTLFWHGHFATNYRTIENSYHMLLQNGMFRRNAMGNFGELLFALIRDPAMLAYLDNNDSRKGKANENLAREIMELFALGIGNYGEKDIKEGARALTGFTFKDDAFEFVQGNHDGGEKQILNRSGNFDGDDFVRIILEQRACAAFITRKLYSFFVSDVPPDERGGASELPTEQRTVLKELASTFLGAKYDLKPVLRRMFLSRHFYSPRFMAEQIKSPVQLVVGAVRSLNVPVRDLSILNDALDLMGQNIFLPPSVKGWEGGRSWINTSTLFVRQNIMAFLIAGKKPQGYDATADTQKYDPKALLAQLKPEGTAPGTTTYASDIADYLLRLTLGHAPESAKAELVAFMTSGGKVISDDRLTGTLLLITAMPEYQLC